MKRHFSGILVITGGVLTVAPLIYKFLLYRLLSQTLIVRTDFDKVKFNTDLPDYYIPACLVIGVICIGLGIVFEIRDRNPVEPL